MTNKPTNEWIKLQCQERPWRPLCLKGRRRPLKYSKVIPPLIKIPKIIKKWVAHGWISIHAKFQLSIRVTERLHQTWVKFSKPSKGWARDLKLSNLLDTFFKNTHKKFQNPSINLLGFIQVFVCNHPVTQRSILLLLPLKISYFRKWVQGASAFLTNSKSINHATNVTKYHVALAFNHSSRRYRDIWNEK